MECGSFCKFMQENHFFCAFIQKYTHAWEKEELCKIVNRVNKSSSANNLPKIELEDIVAGEGRLNKNVTRKFDDRKGIHFEENNILYGKLRPYLKKWLIPDFKGIALGDFWVLEAKDSIPIFDYFLIQSDKYQKVANNTSGTKMPRSDWKQVSTTEFYIPQNSEQTKIGNFFQVLDNLLTLHQRKCDKLKDLKKGYLQKMFPKGTEKIPEIRFINFDEEWEKRKAKNIFKSVSDKNHPDLPVLSASQEKGMILRSENGIDIKYDKTSTKTYKQVLPGQFVIHLRSFQGGFAYSNVEGITSPAYTILDFIDKGNQFPIFWKDILTSRDFIKRLETVTYGIRDGRSISFTEFSTLNFYFPKIDEQTKIGDFFQTLDQQITQQESKLKHLKQLKKAYLQNMFV